MKRRCSSSSRPALPTTKSGQIKVARGVGKLSMSLMMAATSRGLEYEAFDEFEVDIIGVFIPGVVAMVMGFAGGMRGDTEVDDAVDDEDDEEAGFQHPTSERHFDALRNGELGIDWCWPEPEEREPNFSFRYSIAVRRFASAIRRICSLLEEWGGSFCFRLFRASSIPS